MTTHSGDTSPGGSNSLSNSSVRTRTSEESQAAPHKPFNLDCYNSSPEQDDESEDQYDEEALSQLMLHSDLFRRGTSVGMQTDYNEDFPPLQFLRALGEDPSGFMNQQPFFFASGGSEVPPSQQDLSQMSIPTLSATAAPTTTTATAVSTNTAADASSSSSDGTLQLVIQNFRHMSDTVRGPCKYIQGVPWRIMVMPRQHVVQKKGTQKCLGFFLQCCPDAYSESWSCQASAELRLISQKPGIPNFIRKTNHIYTSKENDWGYSCFMTWADILDESQGYIKEDKVTLEVQVKAEPPKNILTHSEFKKKIQDYKRLADLQSQRGLIDKAIECNTQALKFCKDKDPQCKAELEAQKAHLIEMKLKQSIQRIEKGNDGTKIEDDTTTNLNALRQALGTSTRCNNSANNNNSNKATTTKNKATSTKDSTTAPAAVQNNNSNDISATEMQQQQQQQQRAPTPTYTKAALPAVRGPILGTVLPRNDAIKPTQKTSKSVEPLGQKTTTASGTSTGKEENKSSSSKKRLYKSASTEEVFCAAGTKCKDDFEYMKDQYEEEEGRLPDQIRSFFTHLSEEDKNSTRLREQIERTEMVASPFEKTDPFLEGLMKLNPEDADKAFINAITFCTYERDSERMNATQLLEKRLSKVIRNKFCDSCLKGKAEKRETSEFGCQTEFARRIPREAIPRMMQQLEQQQQQNLLGVQANEEYLNALKSQAYAAVQQQQQQQQQNQAINAAQQQQQVPALPTRRKKATAKKNLQQQQQQMQQIQQNFEQQLQQQQHFQQQFMQQSRVDGTQVAGEGMDLNDPSSMEMFAAATKPLMGAHGFDMTSLANLDLSKIQFPTDPTMIDPNQPQGTNIFSRQYIEEWLRYSTRNLLKANFDAGDKQQQQQSSMAGGSAASGSAAADSTAAENSANNPMLQMYPLDNQDFTATQAALVQLHCLNAKNIKNKIEEFVQALETNPNFRDLRNNIDRLLALCVDDENFATPEDTISVVSVSECTQRIGVSELDLTKDPQQEFSNLQRSFLEDDPHDYMLLRELKQQELMLATRLNSILFQLHQASISDIVDRLEAKLKVLGEKLKDSKGEILLLKMNDKKLNEQVSLTHKDYANMSIKYEKLIQQLKDRKNEIKKLEKKAKSEAQLAAENIELQEKFDAMKKELGQAQRQLADEQAKYKRDTQSLADSKKHLNVELNAKYSEMQKLNTQLEEKAQALKKVESQLANERKSNAQSVTNLTERINLLEHKLEDGLRVLERAKEDCAAQIKGLESEKQKRTAPADLEIIKRNLSEWESKREEVTTLINQAKVDFHAHIQSIKSGKQLSQLSKIQVPKPPPCPKLQPLPPIQLQQVPPSPLPLDRKVITPPGRARGGGATTPQPSQLPPMVGHVPPSPGGPPPPFQPLGMAMAAHNQQNQAQQQHIPPPPPPPSANVTPVKATAHFQPQHNCHPMNSQPPPPPGHHGGIAPIGQRPSNYQNGISVPPPSAAAMSQQHSKFTHQMHQRQSPQLGNLIGGGQQPNHFQAAPQQQMHNMAPPPPSSSIAGQQHPQQSQQQPQQTWNTGWGDQLNMNNISELFGQGRSFGPLGSDFGGGSQSATGFRSSSVTHQPPAGVIGAPSSAATTIGASAANPPSSQPIGAGRNVQNASPSQQAQQQQRNGWSSFSADTWNPPLSGRQN